MPGRSRTGSASRRNTTWAPISCRWSRCRSIHWRVPGRLVRRRRSTAAPRVRRGIASISRRRCRRAAASSSGSPPPTIRRCSAIRRRRGFRICSAVPTGSMTFLTRRAPSGSACRARCRSIAGCSARPSATGRVSSWPWSSAPIAPSERCAAATSVFASICLATGARRRRLPRCASTARAFPTSSAICQSCTGRACSDPTRTPSDRARARTCSSDS